MKLLSPLLISYSAMAMRLLRKSKIILHVTHLVDEKYSEKYDIRRTMAIVQDALPVLSKFHSRSLCCRFLLLNLR